MSTTTPVSPLTAFHWEVQPQAEALVLGAVQEFLSRCPQSAALAERLQRDTGTRFVDWVDYLVIPEQSADRWLAAGFSERTEGQESVLVQPHGIFPRVLLRPGARRIAALKAESVADFLAAHSLDIPIEGAPLSPFRQATICRCEETELRVVERHGSQAFAAESSVTDEQRLRSLYHLERFRTRRRHFPTDVEGFAHASALIDDAMAELGRDWARDLFFAAERDFWQRRNRSAQWQKARQDALGLGWANHDHHTYRSSRECFTLLIGISEKLGFTCRERFTPGREAGWGAQVLEQPVTGITIFADVDMSPEELLGDFAHQPLPTRHELGTVGLWCALHGEAFLEAGMHHLECQFAFDALREQMAANGLGMMKPFTDFGYLRQAFTAGERWPVSHERIERLLAGGRITQYQADRFRAEGAIGSHLENLERNQGFKGFNQHGITEIIEGTDPRRQ